MNYLDRPVFLLRPNWARAVTRRATFDLRPEDIGYGAEYFTPAADWTVNQWHFELMLAGAAAIAECNGFFDALAGPLNGFWLPVPATPAAIVAGASTTGFSIRAQNFSESWNDRPDVYLLFTFSDGSRAAARLQSVTAAGDTETVTLTAALPQIPDALTQVQRLHYVRLADDVEEGAFLAEAVMARRVAVEELPHEYESAALGLRPIFLFKFWSAAPAQAEWRYTSFAAPVVSANELFAAGAFNFSDLVETEDGGANDLELAARPEAGGPLMSFVPAPFSAVMFVEIYAVDYADPDTRSVMFSGRVMTVEDRGTRLVARCESRAGQLRRKIPAYTKGPECQNTLYDPLTCRAGRAWFETSVCVAAIGAADVFPPTVEVTFLIPAFSGKFKPENYLKAGLFEAGMGVTYEARTIIASSWNEGSGRLTLTLNLPLHHTAVADQAQVVAGCDHTSAHCVKRFNNWDNFSGFVTIPTRNPVLMAVTGDTVSQGGK